MSFVLVNLDFSDCMPEHRTEIYRHLAEWKWIRMNQDDSDINSVWLANISSGVTGDQAVSHAKNKFYSCCQPDCMPKAAFEYGYNETGLLSLMMA